MIPSESMQQGPASNESQSELPAKQLKKAYHRPTFTNLGSIAQFTQAGTGAIPELYSGSQ